MLHSSEQVPKNMYKSTASYMIYIFFTFSFSNGINKRREIKNKEPIKVLKSFDKYNKFLNHSICKLSGFDSGVCEISQKILLLLLALFFKFHGFYGF